MDWQGYGDLLWTDRDVSWRQGKITEVKQLRGATQATAGGSAGGSFILTAIAGWRGSMEISKDMEK
jgi:hypothetical protein